MNISYVSTTGQTPEMQKWVFTHIKLTYNVITLKIQNTRLGGGYGRQKSAKQINKTGISV